MASGGFKPNNPGCACCQDPFCCDGTPPATITVEVQSVTGTGTNSGCTDTSCANSYNNTGVGIDLTYVADTCSWGVTELVEPLCNNSKYGCFPSTRTWTVRLINAAGNWFLRLDISTAPSGFPPEGGEYVRYEKDYLTTRPTCDELSLSVSMTLIQDLSCCSFSGALVGLL